MVATQFLLFPLSSFSLDADKACFASSIGYITLKTTAVAEDCVVAKMAKLVEEAQNSKSSTQRFIDRCAKFYTPGWFIVI